LRLQMCGMNGIMWHMHLWTWSWHLPFLKLS
jgi:hypothetical protein